MDEVREIKGKINHNYLLQVKCESGGRILENLKIERRQNSGHGKSDSTKF